MAGKLDYAELLGVAHVALVQAAKLWPGVQDFAPFATTRIINRIRDAIRDASRHKRNTGHTLPIIEDEIAESETESVYFVREWIERLPVDERLAIRFAYGIGTRKRTNAEIAKAMRCSPRKAADTIRSGLLRLRYLATVEVTHGT